MLHTKHACYTINCTHVHIIICKLRTLGTLFISGLDVCHIHAGLTRVVTNIRRTSNCHSSELLIWHIHTYIDSCTSVELAAALILETLSLYKFF